MREESIVTTPARIALSVLFGVLISAQLVAAQEGFVADKRRSSVFIWRSEVSMKDGVTLLNAKQPDLAAKYASCIVAQNTRVAFLTGGYESIPVMVIEGPHRGCRGNVEAGVAFGPKK
jgi:hypothetical protein